MRRTMALAVALTFSVSCATRRTATSYRVLPAQPEYLLRSPDSNDTPFPEVLGRYTQTGPGWVELRPQIGLRLENAYFREGAPKHGLSNFIGTEIARYQVLATGALEQVSIESRLATRLSDQLPVQQLVSESQRLHHHHRLFYQVLLNRKADVRRAVLLSAASTAQLDRLTERLTNEPDVVCGSASSHCTVFPEACTASLEIAIVVNGAARTVPWSSVLADVVERHRHLELFRPYVGQLALVEIDPQDTEALRLPLLPGDVIKSR